MVFTRIASLMTGGTPSRSTPLRPPAGLIIRRPTNEERAVLDDIFRRSWTETYGNALAEPERFLALPQNAHVKSNSLCAILNGQPIGFIEFSRQVFERSFFWKKLETEVVSVLRLYVDPQHQSHGVGRELLATIRHYFPGAASIALTVFAGMTRVEDFYRRCGFSKSITFVTDDGVEEPLRLHVFNCSASGLPRSLLPETAMCFEEAGPVRWAQRRDAPGIDGQRDPD